MGSLTYIFYLFYSFRESSLPKPRLDFSTDAFDSTMAEARNRASRAITEGEREAKILSVPVMGRSLLSRGYLDTAILSVLPIASIGFN